MENSIGQKVKKSEPLYTASENTKLFNCYAEQLMVPQKVSHRITYHPTIALVGM